MKKLFILLIVFSFFYSCETIETQRQRPAPRYTAPDYKVVLVKHPDLNLYETDMDSLKNYEVFRPLDNKSSGTYSSMWV